MKTRTAKLFLMLASAALLALPVWPATSAGAQSSRISTTSATKRGSDYGRDYLIKKIRHEIIMLPYYGVFDNIEFTLENGKVTLLGQVTWPTTKSGAERVVKKVEGVQSVENRIQVLPASPMDDQLRWRLYRVIYGDSMLGRYALDPIKPIRIIVDHGNVTLEGTVRTQAEKNVASIRANGVADVFHVTNNLLVEKS